jgi:hypothetical protein
VDGDTIIVHLDEIIFGATITIPESTPEPPLGTSDHPQTNFNAVIERTDALAETRQSFLSSQRGWLYIANKEYMPLDYKGEGTYINSTFTTEQMLSETWYHTLGDGSADQFITRYTDANGLVTTLTVFIDGYYVNFFGDTINQAPQKLFVIPNDAAWVRELLGEVQAYTANEPSVSAYGEQVGGRSRYSLQITTIYNVPLPAETNQWGQTITGDKVNYMFDIETGQLLSQENISVADSGERLVDFSRNFQAESWLTTLPDDLAFYLAQAQTRLNNSNLTWIAPTPTPDFNPALAQVSDTQYGITVSVLDVNDKQGEVAVMMTAQVDPSWGVDHAFPFFQTFISLPLLYGEGERPFTPTHASGEVVEVDETTGGWREGSTHYFAGELSEGEALWLEAAVELTGIHHVITLPLTLADAEVGQIWSLDWPISLGAAQLVLSEVVWEEGTADGTAQLRLTLVDNNPPDLTLGCLHIATTDPWQELCDNDERSFVVTVPTDKAVQLHLRANINVTGFELRWQP